MYDPVMSRFLSPDPIIQFPENSQSYNSYSYVLNNPLRFTDPSGFLAEGDSTANGKNTNWSEATAKALSIVGSSYDKEEESISSFNTDYTQTGKTESITEENSVSDKTKAVEGDRRVGSAGGSDGISMNDAETMLSAFGYSHFGKTQLLKWGMKGADWGKAGANYLKFNLKTGKTVGYAGVGIYGFNSYSSFANGNNLQGVSNGLMSMYSFIATKGGVPGMVLTAPFFAIDATIGMDNFLLYYNSYHIDQSNQIQNGYWGVSLWRPGRALK